VSPVRYELSFYITEGGILHSHRREILKSYICVHSLIRAHGTVMSIIVSKSPTDSKPVFGV
jgi:hypothetical protein